MVPVFGSKYAAIMNELHAHIMYNVFDMHYNSSYSSILYWNYGTLGIIIEAPIHTTKHQHHAHTWKFCRSQFIICIKYNNTCNNRFLVYSVFLNTPMECHVLP